MKNGGRWVVFFTAVAFILIGTIMGALGAPAGYATALVVIGGATLVGVGLYTIIEE